MSGHQHDNSGMYESWAEKAALPSLFFAKQRMASTPNMTIAKRASCPLARDWTCRRTTCERETSMIWNAVLFEAIMLRQDRLTVYFVPVRSYD